MAFNLSNFRNKIKSVGFNQYFVVRIPQIADSETVTALARSTELPAFSFGNQDIFYRGLSIKVADKPTFSDWSVSFLCDEAHTTRNIFLKWMSNVYSTYKLENTAHNNYKVDGLSVSQISYDGVPVATYTFYGAYPSNVGNIGLDQNGGTVQTFDVTFSYDYWLMNSKEGDVEDASTTGDFYISNNGKFAGVSLESVAGLGLNLAAGT